MVLVFYYVIYTTQYYFDSTLLFLYIIIVLLICKTLFYFFLFLHGLAKLATSDAAAFSYISWSISIMLSSSRPFSFIWVGSALANIVPPFAVLLRDPSPSLARVSMKVLAASVVFLRPFESVMIVGIAWHCDREVAVTIGIVRALKTIKKVMNVIDLWANYLNKGFSILCLAINGRTTNT